MNFPEGLPIGSGWIPAPSTAPVYFPYDGSVVAQAPIGTVDLARQALENALSVRAEVGRLPSHVRRRALQGALSALAAQRDAFVDLLVLETGKPLVDCRVEVERTLLTLETSAEEVARLHGETVPLDLLPSGDGLQGFWIRKPIGVVVGITGFNYPLLLASHKLAPALAAGCPVIIKPAPQTPLATLWLVHLVREALEAAGAPTAAVQLVTGGPEVGATLTTDRRIGAVSFTGSATVGHQIARDAAPTKVLLELGSNSALVVAADANLPAAADAVIRGGYYASGQACISIQRVIVEEPVRAAFLAELTPRLAQVVVGDPRDPATRVSALIDPTSTTRVQTWITTALTAGATLAHPHPETPTPTPPPTSTAPPPAASTPAASTPAASTPAASTPATSTPAASTPAASAAATNLAPSDAASAAATNLAPSDAASAAATNLAPSDVASAAATNLAPSDVASAAATNLAPSDAASAAATYPARSEATSDVQLIGPTVLLDPASGPAWDEEIFGPVIAIRSVPDLATAFDTVNASRYGLHASVFTSSLETAFAAIDQLDVGGVVVNEVPGFRSDVMPYGGVKDSGTGREGPRFAIEELTTTRMAIIRPKPLPPKP